MSAASGVTEVTIRNRCAGLRTLLEQVLRFLIQQIPREVLAPALP